MASAFDDKMGEIFDVLPLRDEEGKETYHEIDPSNLPATMDECEDQDYIEARQNLRELAKQASNALMEATRVAQQSEHPRAWEVVSGLAKQVADINHQWIDLHEKRAKLKQQKKGNVDTKEGERNVTNNNAFFMGTTDELQDLLQKQLEGNK